MMKLAQPTKDQLDLIYGEFDTSRERIREDVQSLIAWMAKQAHLPNVTDEEYLEHFLLRCKNSIELAKVVLERYFSLKAVLPEIYDNRNPNDEELLQIMKAISFIPLPELTPEGSRVSVFRISDPDKYETADSTKVIKSMIMSGDLRVQIDSCHSDVFIFDLENFSIPVVTKVLGNLRKFILPGTRGIPMRQKQYYIINAKPATESILIMAKSILPKNLTKKMTVLKNAEELIDILPKKCLPKDYGGDLPPFGELNVADVVRVHQLLLHGVPDGIPPAYKYQQKFVENLLNQDTWMKTLQHYADWFKKHDSLKADNSKRLNREDSKLGDVPLEGSFRQISFD